MKIRKFKIKIQSHAQFRSEVVGTWQAAEDRKVKNEDYDLVLSFPDLSWLAKVLSPERIRIIQAVKEHKPESIYQLAKLLGRAPANVQNDIHDLHDLGIIDL